MKMCQALVLGVAVGLVAVSGAAAAERHVSPQTADQAKKCSTYGAGFLYIPGADLCMKVGGWVRAQAGTGSGRVNWGALNANPGSLAAGNASVGTSGYVTTDIREQTGYGTFRAYLSVGAKHQ